MRALVPLLLLLSAPALAVPESELLARWDRDIWPYMEAGKRGFISGVDGVPLSFVAFERDDEKAALVILPGRGGAYVHFAEFIYDLRHERYSIYGLDHRGQGLSGHMLSNAFKGHVEDFEHYTTDVKTFLDTVVKTRPGRKIILVGHSMGGAIASRVAEEHPEDLTGVVLLAPMHQANYGQFTEELAGLIAASNVAMGRAELYAIGQTDPKEPETFETQRGTQSTARFEAGQKTAALFPQLRLGGVTYGWANESVKGSRRARSDAFRIPVPVLLIQSGKDEVVMNSGQDEFCSRARFCQTKFHKDAKHSPHNERDDIRDAVMADVLQFLDETVAGGAAPGCQASGGAGMWPLALLGFALRRRRGQRPHMTE